MFQVDDDEEEQARSEWRKRLAKAAKPEMPRKPEDDDSDNERQQVLRDLYQLDMQNEDAALEFRREKKRRKRTASTRQDIVILE